MNDNIPKTIWTYSSYRATLRKNGRFFAIVTPDGKNSLTQEAAVELIETLQRGSNERQQPQVKHPN